MIFLTVIAGILVIIAGIWYLSVPSLSFLAVCWILCALVLVEGIGEIFAYASRQKKAYSQSGWSLAAGIMSLAFGIIMGCCNLAKTNEHLFMVYFFTCWMLLIGIIAIIKGTVKVGSGGAWWLTIIAGILMTIMGIIAFIKPAVNGMGELVYFGISAIFAGVDLITVSIASV